MQMFKRVINSVVLAFICCAVLSAGTVIYLMFAKASDPGRYTGLFGSVYFEYRETSSGSFMLGLGVDNPWVFSVIFLVIFAFAMIFQDILSLLKKRRQNLLENLDEAQA